MPQFERYLGVEANVRLRVPVDGRRRFRGVIEKVMADKVALLVEGRTVEMLHADIERAGLAPPAPSNDNARTAKSRPGKRRDSKTKGSKRVKTR